VSKRVKYVRWLLVTLLLLSAGRVVGFAVLFGRESLQLDFSAFYTAGQATACGLSPYQNHLAHTPPIWDGFGLLQHSRFLYPPLAARVFQPLAHLPYRVAKGVWTGLALVCIACAMWVAHKSLRARMGRDAMIVAGICVCLFHPVLALLERGQVDGITLALLAAFVYLIQRKKKQRAAAGLCLALATLLKLHCVYFAPFLILRKKWIALAGFTSGCLLIGLCSLALDGYAVCYAGHSMGGAVGVLRASVDARIRGLISLAGMVDTRGFAQREFGDVTPGAGNMWDDPACPLSQAYLDDLTAIGTVVDRATRISVPWLLVHGTEDDVVPLGDSQGIFEQANEPKKLVVLQGADHVFSGDATQAASRAVLAWLKA